MAIAKLLENCTFEDHRLKKAQTRIPAKKIPPAQAKTITPSFIAPLAGNIDLYTESCNI